MTMFRQGTLDRNGDGIVSRKLEEENGVCLKVVRASYVLGICKVGSSVTQRSSSNEPNLHLGANSPFKFSPNIAT